ncbi:MAG: hypothetical protein P8Z68_06290 [Kineosporiaceae bacterium]|jgi:hypothetical protein
MPDRQLLTAVLSDFPERADAPPRATTTTVQEVADSDRVQIRVGTDGSGRDTFGEFDRVTSSELL